MNSQLSIASQPRLQDWSRPQAQPRHTPPRIRLATCLLALTALALTLPALALPAQTLARPGWAGSGLTVERWWRHAILVSLPASTPDLEPTPDALNARLDTLRTLGVDAILLRGLTPIPPTQPSTAAVTTTDDLFHEAGRHNLRVLIELPASQPTAELAAAARGWAARGAAGFLIPNAGPDALRAVRSALHTIPGERLLITTAATPPKPTPPNRRTTAHSPNPGLPAELYLLPIAGLTPQPDPTKLRASLANLSTSPSTPLITTEQPPTAPEASTEADLARTAAAITLLTTSGASLLDQTWLAIPTPASPNHSPFDQLRQFTALHHDRPAFRDGSTTVLDHAPEGALVWLRRGPANTTVVIACNLRPTPLRLSLTDDLARLHLRGTFLKTLSRSDPGLGAMPLDALTLPPFGVYIGELSR